MNTINSTRFVALLLLLAFMAGAPALAAQVSSLDETGEEAGLTNTVCPVTPGEAVDPSFSTEYKGARVYFCCKRCLLRFKQDPEAYLDTLAQVMPASFETAPSQVEAGDHDDHDHAHGDEGDKPQGEVHGHNDAAEPAGHNHATDHSVLPLASLGRLHVVAIHFPIAFLILGAIVEAGGLLRKQWRFPQAVRLLAAVGALSALGAMGLGLLHGSAGDYAGTLSWVFWWHRALGIAVAVAAVAAWVMIEIRARRQSHGPLATAALFVTAALVGIAGHFGGSLVYGWEYLLP